MVLTSNATSAVRIAVVIPTHNPRPEYLAAVLAALEQQSLPRSAWEVVLVDNASSPAVPVRTLAWHPAGRVVAEPRLGLTHARLTALRATLAPLLVWVDDDNVLAPDYLERTDRLFAAQPQLGAAGGKSLPVYATPPPRWFHPGLAPLGCRDLGETEILCAWNGSHPREYPASAPIGAGLAIRRVAMQAWADAVNADPIRQRLGRTGTALTSGEDNDINLTLLAAGWQLLYSPDLVLHHLIPPQRLTLSYQKRLARASHRDFVTVLRLHGVCPWRPVPSWLVGLLKARAWVAGRAWASPQARIRWASACGQFEGRAAKLR